MVQNRSVRKVLHSGMDGTCSVAADCLARIASAENRYPSSRRISIAFALNPVGLLPSELEGIGDYWSSAAS